MPNDFRQIPPPDAIIDVTYEVYVSEMLEQLKMLNDRFTTIKESDPSYAIIQIMGYEIASKVQEVNESVRSVMLLTSTGADLDNLGVIYQEKRRVLSTGNPDVNPPIPAVLESDSDYRIRLLSAFKSLALGSSDWYRKRILESGSPFEQTVKDMSVLGPEDNDDIDIVDPEDLSVLAITPGQVWCYIESILILAEDESVINPAPIPSSGLLLQIENYLDKNIFPGENLPRSQSTLRRFIGDTIVVRSCIQKPYTIQAIVTPLIGLDKSEVKNKIENIGLEFVKNTQRIGQKIPLSSIYAELDTDEVFELDLLYPTGNIEPKLNELPIASIPFELEVKDYIKDSSINWNNFSGQLGKWAIIQDNSSNWNIVFSNDISVVDRVKLQGVGIGRKFNILDKSVDPPTTVLSNQVSSLLSRDSDHYYFRLLEVPDLTSLSTGELYVSFNSSVDILVSETGELNMANDFRDSIGGKLLPNSSSELEIEIANIFINYSNDTLKVLNTFDNKKEIPVRYMWDIDRCPSKFLPFLATALGVDDSIFNFQDEQIREVIKLSFKINQIRGTIESIFKLIQEGLNYKVTKIEEGNRDFGGADDWALYRVHIETPIPAIEGPALTKLVKNLAPERCKLDEIFFTNAHTYDGSIKYDGTFTYGSISTT